MSTITVTTRNSEYVIRHAPTVKGGPATIKHNPLDGSPSRTNGVFVTVNGFRFAHVGTGSHVQLVTDGSPCGGVSHLRSSIVHAVDADGVRIPVGVARIGSPR
jgi:hypothetical protein